MSYVVGSGGHARVLAAAMILKSCPERAEFIHSDAAKRLSGVELVCGIGLNPHRKRVIDELTELGFIWSGVWDPTAIVRPNDGVDLTTQILAGAIIQPGTTIGAHTIVNTRASVDHDCGIGAHAFIGPGATICGNVIVGEEGFIGAGATILPGVTIGAGATVGAGAVVLRDVPAGEVWIENPARRMR